MQKTGVAEAFARHFELAIADSQALREDVYRIRYEVYCREFGFERPERFPDRMELDDYDDCSQHCVLIHRATSRSVGCLRLIAAHQDCGERPLPFEAFCPASFDSAVTPKQLPRSCFGEMSRLAVIEAFRRRRSDEDKPITIPEHDQPEPDARRTNFPLIPVGLFLAGIAMFLRSDKDFVFAMMEPRLSRLLQRFGILFAQAGEVADYHGPRAPFVIDRGAAASSLSQDVAEMLSHIDSQLFGSGSPRTCVTPG